MPGFLVFSLWITLWIALGKTAGLAVSSAGMQEGGVQEWNFISNKNNNIGNFRCFSGVFFAL
jgi:hypothetical protein